MDKINLDPYLYFAGDCKEAMEFYKSIFGGNLEVQTYSEFSGDMPGKNEHPDWVMHCLLDGDVRLMASDSQKASPSSAKVELSLSGTDDAKLRNCYNGLSSGGKVTMPLEKAPWGDTFGMLSDKYGIDWVINISEIKE
ncbi:VOC family protein [Candidatus Saccharibacteria bacterium]|nr:VOC family protein [Candidatus Saccharibacteria bacterium]